MLVSNIRDLLTDAGDIPDDLPEPARRLLRRLSQVVVEVTTSVPQAEITSVLLSVRCVRRPNGKACPGELYGGYSSETSSAICWECACCGDAGVITGWDETQWDGRHQQKQIARRGWKRARQSSRRDVPMSLLRQISVYRENDLFDFARLWSELRALSDEKHRMPGVVTTTRMSVHGLALAFASFIDPLQRDLPAIRAAIEKAAFSPDATIVEDE